MQKKGGHALVSKKGFLLLFVFLLAFSLAACQSQGSDAPESENSQNNASDSEGTGDQEGSDEPEQITLSMYWWGSQTRHNRTEEVIKMYEEQNPHVTISAEFTGWDGYWKKLAANAAGNNMPDVLQMNYGEYMSQYANKDLLASLGTFTEDGTIDVSNVGDSLLASGKVKDQLLGIPLGMNAPAVLFDSAKLEEAGADIPSTDWTWDDYKQISTQVHEELGHYGTRTFEAENVFVDYYVRQQGGHLFAQDGSPALGYDDDQILVDYFKLNKGLIDQGVAAPLEVTQQIQGVEDELIVHGKSAFDFRWSNQVAALSNAAQRPLELITFPGPNVEQGMYLKPAMFFSVSKTSEHKEEAAKFLNFFINNLEAAQTLGTDRGVPVSSAIREEMRPTLNDVQKETFEYIDSVSENSSPIDAPFPAGASEVVQTLVNVNEKVMYGEMTPEEGATSFREEAEMILEREN